MASFVGTNKEFRRYIGPRLRNLVQQFTKKHKTEISACQYCGSKDNLESAHIHGRGRNEIIDLVLKENTHNDIATVDIDKFEERFKKEHHPFEKSILILCRPCHKKYDSRAPQPIKEPQDPNDPHNPPASVLPITLEPSDSNIFKKELLISKQAEIKIFYSDGRIERKLWNAARFSISSNVLGNLRSRPEYRSGKWQSRGIVKIHVKVIKMPNKR